MVALFINRTNLNKTRPEPGLEKFSFRDFSRVPRRGTPLVRTVVLLAIISSREIAIPGATSVDNFP